MLISQVGSSGTVFIPTPLPYAHRLASSTHTDMHQNLDMRHQGLNINPQVQWVQSKGLIKAPRFLISHNNSKIPLSHSSHNINHNNIHPFHTHTVIMAGIARALSEGTSNLTLGGDCYVPKNILLTGGAGFIGSHVAIKLVNANPDYKVRTL